MLIEDTPEPVVVVPLGAVVPDVVDAVLVAVVEDVLAPNDEIPPNPTVLVVVVVVVSGLAKVEVDVEDGKPNDNVEFRPRPSVGAEVVVVVAGLDESVALVVVVVDGVAVVEGTVRLVVAGVVVVVVKPLKLGVVVLELRKDPIVDEIVDPIVGLTSVVVEVAGAVVVVVAVVAGADVVKAEAVVVGLAKLDKEEEEEKLKPVVVDGVGLNKPPVVPPVERPDNAGVVDDVVGFVLN